MRPNSDLSITAKDVDRFDDTLVDILHQLFDGCIQQLAVVRGQRTVVFGGEFSDSS